MKRHTAAQVGDVIGKTEHWVKRNAARLPHSRAGKTYFWTDADLTDLLESLRKRPAETHTPGAPKPFTGRRAS